MDATARARWGAAPRRALCIGWRAAPGVDKGGGRERRQLPRAAARAPAGRLCVRLAGGRFAVLLLLLFRVGSPTSHGRGPPATAVLKLPAAVLAARLVRKAVSPPTLLTARPTGPECHHGAAGDPQARARRGAAPADGAARGPRRAAPPSCAPLCIVLHGKSMRRCRPRALHCTRSIMIVGCSQSAGAIGAPPRRCRWRLDAAARRHAVWTRAPTSRGGPSVVALSLLHPHARSGALLPPREPLLPGDPLCVGRC